MSPRVARDPGVLLAATLAGAALGLASEWAYRQTGAVPAALVSDLLVGWAFIAAGLLLWWRQPSNGTGLLLLAEGVSWFFANLQGAGIGLLVFIGGSLGGVNHEVLVHILLAAPRGRLPGRAERVVVGAAYAVALAFGVAYALTDWLAYDPYRCRGCTSGALSVPLDPGLLDAVEVASLIVIALIAAAVLTLIVRRWVRSTVLGRRLIVPIWLSSGVCLTLMALFAVQDGLGPALGPLQSALVWVSDAGQVSVLLAFLVMVLRFRLARSAMAEMLLELGPSAPPGTLRQALAAILDDPSLDMLVWLPHMARYASLDGRPAEVPGDDPLPAVTLVDQDGQALAALVHDPLLVQAGDLLDAAAAAVRLGLTPGRRQAELREAADAERRRVERDLHDGAQQRFVLLSATLRSARTLASRQQDRAAQNVLARAEEELRLGLRDLRELARGLHPAALTVGGLVAAIESLTARAPLPVRVTVDAGRLPPTVETTAYFVVAEALANVARHARARSATVCACRDGGRLIVEITDDGAGGADPRGGSGLSGLRDRLAAVGGVLTVESPPGGGTRVRAELPCE